MFLSFSNYENSREAKILAEGHGVNAGLSVHRQFCRFVYCFLWCFYKPTDYRYRNHKLHLQIHCRHRAHSRYLSGARMDRPVLWERQAEKISAQAAKESEGFF